ncbi:MAG: hypothetical protein DHS20C14_03550 [Phycisphaeraceae bacterium]|nr:MAG: hypothetical protein DHS20C14_03550 [Phycisphaeraceae bacterium]
MRRLIPALALLAAAAPASADWLRVDFHAVTTPYLTFQGPEPFDAASVAGESYAIDGWMLIDTAAAPLPGGGDSVYAVADFEITARRYDGAGAEPVILSPEAATALVLVIPETSGVRFLAGNLFTVFSYDIPRTATPFTNAMRSLPDAPGAYAVSGASADTVECAFTPPSGTPTDCLWDRDAGGHEVHKYIRYHVRATTAPPPEPCGPADIDGNGVLNVDDIEQFVIEFLDGCDV